MGVCSSIAAGGFGQLDASCRCRRGFVYAIAHVRGGGDLGAYWHADGMLMNKRNTFTDFITCAEHLIQACASPAPQLEGPASP